MADETTLRLGVFLSVFFAMALAEVAAPRRKRVFGRSTRWATNIAISVIDSLTVWALKITLGAAAVLAAQDAAQSGIGLFHVLDWPLWLAALAAFVVLDFAIWLQHLASHKIPVLWRLHQVHHADRDMDVTTAVRFHPLEIALSMLFKIALVYALGAPVVAVIAFEIVLNASAMFNHANIRLPRALDRALRRVIVTPDMHRVHHSTDRREHDANYGFNLAIWDRIFRTYVAEPRHGHEEMRLGLPPYQGDAPTRLGWSLILPFRK